MNQQLMETFDVPVWIDNEANFGVLGEQTYNTSEHQKNILYLSVGIGIGAGLILDGNLFKGMHGHAGEVGHMTMEMNGPTCRCGNLGCWELYASEQALLTHSNSSRTLEELLKLAKTGDQQAVQQFENVARYLGAGIVSLIHTFSPNQIIIGNRLALAHNYLYQELIATVEKRMFAEQLHTEIVFSELVTDSTVLGATAFSIEQFIDDHQHHKINRTI
ncbi:ROK family protein [Alkalicoccobacillus plakortidis]|uniref:ROK family protein n=1 Tax=Alkalicoccobacillus plakortidis TaxID=444060 RepID=UPI0027D9C4BF|nr:ROK family protein [Alkalicoccobacillus plakortidis]